jgi:hypothetical protein
MGGPFGGVVCEVRPILILAQKIKKANNANNDEINRY